MWGRASFSISAFDFQKMIEDFTLNTKPFTAFSSTKLDHIFRFYFPQMKDWMYSKCTDDVVIFVGPPEFNVNEFERVSGLKGVRVKEIDRPLDIKLISG